MIDVLYASGILSVILQGLVVYYGIRLYSIVGHTKYWSIAWKLYLCANSIILVRRLVGIVGLMPVLANNNNSKIIYYKLAEQILAIGVSVLFLLFGKKLNCLFTRYMSKEEN